MPMCDIYIQEGALEASAEADLVAQVSRLLSNHEVQTIRDLGGDAAQVEARVQRAESIAWMFVHRTDTFVAGKAVGPQVPSGPVYKFEVTIPEGLINEEYLHSINRDVLAALTEAERGRWRYPELRLWIVTKEVTDGYWGAAGQPFPLRNVVEYVAEGWGDAAVERMHEKKRAIAADPVATMATATATVSAATPS